MDIVLLLARLLLAATFLLAGVSKLVDRRGSRHTLIDFGVPASVAPALSILLPLAEVIVAIALLPLATAWAGALGALGLLLIFMAGISYNLARGRRPNCHCFGHIHSEPVGRSTLVRNGVLAALAGFLVWQGPHRVGVSAFAWLADLTTGETIALLLGAAGLAGVAALTWLLTQIMAQQGRILSRLETLEANAAAAPTRTVPPAETRNGTPAVPQGLPVGAPAPAFALPDLEGRGTSLAELLGRRKPVLLLFVDPQCGPCSTLLPTAAEWATRHADAFTLVLVSRGTPKENRKKFATDRGFRALLLQDKYEVAERYSTLALCDGLAGFRRECADYCSPLAESCGQGSSLVASAASTANGVPTCVVNTQRSLCGDALCAPGETCGPSGPDGEVGCVVAGACVGSEFYMGMYPSEGTLAPACCAFDGVDCGAAPNGLWGGCRPDVCCPCGACGLIGPSGDNCAVICAEPAVQH